MHARVEAYDFAVRRQVTALLHGDDIPSVDPRRRRDRPLAAGLLVGVLALGAAAVVGTLGHSDSAPRTLPSDGVIVDSATGGAVVRLGGVLHPALNLSSAKLLAGPRVTTVGSHTLAGLPHGLPVGIPAAPDSLPSQAALTTGPWTACSSRHGLTVSIGPRPPAPLTRGTGVVITSGDAGWLVRDGVRFRIGTAAATLLGLGQTSPVAVPAAMVRLVPVGPALNVPVIDRAGRRPHVAMPFDARIGDLLVVPSTGGRYVVLDRGIAPVDPFAFALLAGAAPTTHSVPARAIARLRSVPRPSSIPARWPRDRVRTAPPPDVPRFCVSTDPTRGTSVSVGESANPAPVPLTVDVPLGGGAVVTSGPHEYVLVTDSGLRYPIIGTDPLRRLGYDPARAVHVPRAFVALVPSGPALDPKAARAPYRGRSQPAR